MTIASPIEGAEAVGFLTGRRHDNDRAFRTALRHSRVVRFMRVAIPAVIVVGSIVAFAAYKWFDPLRALAKLPVSVEGIVVSGTKIMMRQPLVNGFTKDQQPYTVTARTAAQDMANPDTIELQEISATVAMPDQGDVHVSAKDGVYNGKSERLTLQHNVVVRSSEFHATLSQAVVNVRSGDVVSDQPVEVRMLQGTVSANRLEIGESGGMIKFDGGVTLIINRLPASEVTGTTR